MSDYYKRGVVRLIRNNLLKVERKDGTFFGIMEQDGFSPPKVQPKEVKWDLKVCTAWDNVEPDGLTRSGANQYKVLPHKMKGDIHLIPGEHKCSQDFCESPPKGIPTEDVPEFKTDNDLVAINMVTLARSMIGGPNDLTYDEAMEFIQYEMRKLIK